MVDDGGKEQSLETQDGGDITVQEKTYNILFKGEATQQEGGGFSVKGNEFSITPSDEGGVEDQTNPEEVGVVGKQEEVVEGRKNGDKKDEEPVEVNDDGVKVEDKTGDTEVDETEETQETQETAELKEDDEKRKTQEDLIDKLIAGEIDADEFLNKMAEARDMEPEQFREFVKDNLVPLNLDINKINKEGLLKMFDKFDEDLEEVDSLVELVEKKVKEAGFTDKQKIQELEKKVEGLQKSWHIDWEQTKKNRKKGRRILVVMNVVEFILNELNQSAKQILSESLQGK